MRAFVTHLRKHPWQRRALSLSLTVLAAVGVGLAAWPHVREYLLLRDLDSPDNARRAEAVARAAYWAKQSPRAVGRLVAALDGSSDRKFLAVAAALRKVKGFGEGVVGPLNVDRLRALELERITSRSDPNAAAELRDTILAEVLLSGRDNAHVRRSLELGAKDEAPRVRETAAILAARLAHDCAAATGWKPGSPPPPTMEAAWGAISALQADGSSSVAAAAEIAAGAAKANINASGLMTHLIEGRQKSDANAACSAAYAMACLDPNWQSKAVADVLTGADANGQAQIRDRLCWVMATFPSAEAKPAVMAVLERARKAGKRPPAMALLAAGGLGLKEAEADVRGVLADAVKPGADVLVRQVVAALQAADAMQTPCRREVYDICDKLWRPGWPGLLVAAARTLGRQAALDQGDRPNTPSREECVRLLRLASLYEEPPAPPLASAPASAPATQPKARFGTPVESAAAAVALWLLGAELSEWHVGVLASEKQRPADANDSLAALRSASGSELHVPGDYMWWHLGVAGGERALELAGKFLPPYGADANQREYNDSTRSTGALLMAAAARTPAQRQAARERIRGRLEGGPRGGEDNFHVRGAYLCALAMLGDANAAGQVRGLLEAGQIPPRRAVAALLTAGDKAALDWVLWNPQVGPDDMLYLLLDEMLMDVVSGCCPSLPAVEIAGDRSTRLWQLKLLRTTYAVKRSTLKVGRAPAGE